MTFKQLKEGRTAREVYSLLDELDGLFTIRLRGSKREKKVRLDADGIPLKDCYLPHLAVTPTAYARTWKMLDGARKAFSTDSNGEVWERKLLLALEHIVRFFNREIDDDLMRRQIVRLINPLPKGEHIRNSNKKGK